LGQVAEFDDYDLGQVALVQDRTILRASVGNGSDPFYSEGSLPPVPGDSPIIAVRNRDSACAMLANGDVYVFQMGEWLLKGNMFGGATPVHQSSFGAVKARYR